MLLLEDDRQKSGKHELKHDYWVKIGAQFVRMRLPYGDYALFKPDVVVDTKRDIYEVIGNIKHDHTRFRNECLKAQADGCRLVILIENLDGVKNLDDLARWEESNEHFRMRGGKRKFKGKDTVKSMVTMTRRYGVEWDFCTPNESARRVLEILGGDKR